MELTIKITDDDDPQAIKRAVKSLDMALALSSINELLYRWSDIHDEMTQKESELVSHYLEQKRKLISDIMDEYDIVLHELIC